MFPEYPAFDKIKALWKRATTGGSIQRKRLDSFNWPVRDKKRNFLDSSLGGMDE